MKASSTIELRIGNYLIYDKKQVYIAAILKDNSVILYDGFGMEKSTPLETCRYISLTEEWLLKFGFKFNGDSKFWIDKLCLHTKDNELYILYDQGRVFIQYVHQLQNLYFALCGAELELK